MKCQCGLFRARSLDNRIRILLANFTVINGSGWHEKHGTVSWKAGGQVAVFPGPRSGDYADQLPGIPAAEGKEARAAAIRDQLEAYKSGRAFRDRRSSG